MNHRIAGALALAACGLLSAGVARAKAAAPVSPAVTGAGAGEEEIDDPKVARRLKTRASAPVVAAPALVPSSPAPVEPLRVTPPLAARPAVVATPPVAAAPALVPSNPAPATPPPTTTTTATPPPVAGEDAITRKVIPGDGASSTETYVPRLKLGYRRFSFVRVGASDGPQATAAASEPFNVLSLDYYPASSYVRFGLSAQYGAESGKLMGGGDYFFTQTFSLGGQVPGHVFTPFAEAFAGAGYMRRLQFASSVPTAYWQFGIDVGTEVFMAKYADVSIALGYMHPVNGFTRGLSFTSVYVDTWSLKMGFGF